MSQQVFFGDFNLEEMKKVTKTPTPHITFRFHNSLDGSRKVESVNGDDDLPLLKNVDVSKVALGSKLSASAPSFKPGSIAIGSFLQATPSVTESLTDVDRSTPVCSSSSSEVTAEVRATQEVAADSIRSNSDTKATDGDTSVLISLEDVNFLSDSTMPTSLPSPSRKTGKIDFLYEHCSSQSRQVDLYSGRVRISSLSDSQLTGSSPMTPPHSADGADGADQSTQSAHVITMRASSVPLAGSTVQVSSSNSVPTVSVVSVSGPSTTSAPSSTLSTVSASSTSVNVLMVTSPSINTLSSSSPVSSTRTVWNQPKDWGNVFRQAGITLQSSGTKLKESPSVSCSDSVVDKGGDIKTVDKNPVLLELGDKLKSLKVNYETAVELVPRGLINTANLCYLHCILQMLLACPPFVKLMRSFSPDPPLSATPSPTLTLDTMVRFIHEFDTMQEYQEGAKKKKKNRSQEFPKGQAIKSDYIHSVFEKKSSTNRIKGRQEDAEEFLGVILDSLHEEMVSALTVSSSNSHSGMASPESSHNDDVPSEDEGLDETEWEQVGFNNKSMITRQASFSESPVSEIFRGEMLSIVQKQGSKESATVQPFFALPLDIQGEGVETVAQALERHGAKETLSDMKCSKTNTEVEASRKISLSRLPPIFILHLKRFSFNDKGSQKLCKPVDYEMELEIPRELLAPHLRKSPVDQRKYHLTAVVYHHGISSTGGHYTCDVLLPHCGGWINADDSNLCTLSEDKVLKGQNKEKHKVAYLLCYRRADLMP